jgi:hypothetical protein
VAATAGVASVSSDLTVTAAADPTNPWTSQIPNTET